MRHEGHFVQGTRRGVWGSRGVWGGVSRPPRSGRVASGRVGGGSAAPPQYSRGGVGTRVRGGPRAAEEGAKRHSSGGDRCLGVRITLMRLCAELVKPVLLRVGGSITRPHDLVKTANYLDLRPLALLPSSWTWTRSFVSSPIDLLEVQINSNKSCRRAASKYISRGVDVVQL